MRYSKIRSLAAAPYGDTVSNLTWNFFTKNRKGIAFRPISFIPDVDIYILPYHKTETTPDAATVVSNAKYVVRYGQEAIDLSTGNNTNFAMATLSGEIVWVYIEEYL